MTWTDIVRKLTSRKLWLAIGGIATGIAMVRGAETSEIQTVAGAITSLVSAITYIIVEGRVDAANTQNTVLAIEDAAKTVVTSGYMEVIEDED